jgi:hypothetical protein
LARNARRRNGRVGRINLVVDTATAVQRAWGVRSQLVSNMSRKPLTTGDLQRLPLPTAPRRRGSIDVDRLVSQYLAAWNERNRTARMRHLSATWSDDGSFQDPIVCIEGRNAMDEYITQCQASHHGSAFAITEAPVCHHNQIHFAWALLDALGKVLLAGSVCGQLDEDGRIGRLIAFFAPSPMHAQGPALTG